MIIYFTAAVSLKKTYGENYLRIISQLESLGHKVIHEHITDIPLAKIFAESDDEKIEYYKKVLHWISKSDLVVAEVSFPSTLNIGHEISLALEKGKPVLGLYAQEKASPFFQGIRNDKLIYSEYSPENLGDVIKKNIDSLTNLVDTRFNFFISPEIERYLNWVN